MNLGLLPPLGGGLRTIAASGQVGRLLNYYLPRYVDAFERVVYFSYHRESLADYTSAERVLRGVEVFARRGGGSHRLYALRMPLVARKHFERCHVLRVFQAVGAIPALIARARYGTPYVTTYGYKYHQLARIEGRMEAFLLHRLLEPITLRWATGVIVTTSELFDHVSRTVPASRIHLIPNGVDTQLFAPARVAIPSPPVVLFVGRLTRQKNVPVLLKAASQLTHPVEIKMVGDGPLRSELEHMAVSLGVNCHFVGTVEQDQIPAHMKQAALFVLPSMLEGHPKALIEAMSCGLACVASNCDGNRRLIEHGKTGMLYDTHDAGMLADQITQLLNQREMAQTLGQAARRKVVSELDLHQLLTKEVDLLLSVGRGSATIT